MGVFLIIISPNKINTCQMYTLYFWTLHLGYINISLGKLQRVLKCSPDPSREWASSSEPTYPLSVRKSTRFWGSSAAQTAAPIKPTAANLKASKGCKPEPWTPALLVGVMRWCLPPLALLMQPPSLCVPISRFFLAPKESFNSLSLTLQRDPGAGRRAAEPCGEAWLYPCRYCPPYVKLTAAPAPHQHTE